MSVAHFAALGMPPDAAQSRAELIEQVCDGFSAAVGAPPVWSWFVPGRIEVFGKHTDYAGGRSLLAAVPRGFGVAARPRGDGLVRVIDVRYGSRTQIDPLDDGARLTGWASYVQVVARRFARNFPGAPLGLDLAIASDLPRAAGLSSSSVLVVAVATALARRARLEDRPEWREQIASPDDLAWYLGCVENGLDYRRLTGTEGVGTHGGSQDHTAILGCRVGCLTQYRFIPVAREADIRMPDEWAFVIASSGVHADKAGSVKDDYNRAALGIRALLRCWNEASESPAPSLATALLPDGSEQRLRALVAAAAVNGYRREDLIRRLDHFLAENARVPVAARAFAAKDGATLAGLAEESQREADQGLGNQTPETCTLAAAATELGAIAASSFGAGFGGSVWALIPAGDASRFGRAWLEEYRRRVPERHGADWFVARPGPPLTEVPGRDTAE